MPSNQIGVGEPSRGFLPTVKEVLVETTTCHSRLTVRGLTVRNFILFCL
jgi:hypothetical protein